MSAEQAMKELMRRDAAKLHDAQADFQACPCYRYYLLQHFSDEKLKHFIEIVEYFWLNEHDLSLTQAPTQLIEWMNQNALVLYNSLLEHAKYELKRREAEFNGEESIEESI